eukprot:125025-Lingulodinium_polyedra.AAC.1
MAAQSCTYDAMVAGCSSLMPAKASCSGAWSQGTHSARSLAAMRTQFSTCSSCAARPLSSG